MQKGYLLYFPLLLSVSFICLLIGFNTDYLRSSSFARNFQTSFYFLSFDSIERIFTSCDGSKFTFSLRNNLEAYSYNETCGDCTENIVLADCFNKDYPVLGGVDVVEYFNHIGEEDSFIGLSGSIEFTSTYHGYVFYFSSEMNKVLFESDSAKYAPSYGGFCSWGVTSEFCPSFVYTSSCFGPSGNWGAWTIKDNKLFFFLHSAVRDSFNEEYEENNLISIGNKRWSVWYPDSDSTPFSTKCYVNNSTIIP